MNLNGVQNIRSDKRDLHLYLCLLCVGGHSILLGLFIFFFTDSFYGLLFGAEISNYFFVKQSGLFLLCLGLFYVIPLYDLEKYTFVILITIVTKVLAVGFLVLHTSYTPRPLIIFLAAFIDALMAVALAIFLFRSRQ